MEHGRECGEEIVPYPLFVRLDKASVVCIGAGEVAARKVESLVQHGASVTVIAPWACERIEALAGRGVIEWKAKRYVDGDLAQARLAVAASSSREVNEAVADEACRRNVLVNVVDAPDLCTFFVPSVLRRGRLQVAVSTNGASPAVAREIRRELEELFPAWWEDYLDVLADVRALVKERVSGEGETRARLFEAIRAAGLEKRIAAGEILDAEDVYDEVVVPLVGKGGIS